MLRMYRYIYHYKEKGSMPPFLKSYWPISHPHPQDDFAMVMDQRLPNEKPMRSKLPHIDNLSNKQLWNPLNISYSIQWIIFATCLTQKYYNWNWYPPPPPPPPPHPDILCNSWSLGEVLPDKETSFVTWSHVLYHIFYKNNCNHKPTCNKFTAQYVITWGYKTHLTFILVCSVLTRATSSH